MHCHRTSQPSGQHSCFVLRRSEVQISSWRLVILTEVFCGCPQSLQAGAWIVGYLKLGHDPFRSYPFWCKLNTLMWLGSTVAPFSKAAWTRRYYKGLTRRLWRRRRPLRGTNQSEDFRLSCIAPDGRGPPGKQSLSTLQCVALQCVPKYKPKLNWRSQNTAQCSF
jgi:hypothetical protein